MRFFKLFFSRIAIFALVILVQIAFTSFGIYYLQNRYPFVSGIVSILSLLIVLRLLDYDEPASYKIPWITLLFVLPFVGFVMFLCFGNRKISKKRALYFEDVYSVTQNAIPEPDVELKKNVMAYGQSQYILNTCRFPAYPMCYSKFLSSGEAFFECLKEELKKAKKYIFMEYFIIDKGYMWDEIHKILLQKLEEGVMVYVMYDDIGSGTKVSSRFASNLNKEGIKAIRFNKFYPFVSVIHNHRDHRKITIIDGLVGFTGGVNIADEYINVTHPFGVWKDSALMVKGPVVDSLVALFLQNYNVMSRRQLFIDDFIVKNHQNDDTSGYIQVYGSGPKPIYKENIALDVYLNIINQAKKYLYIMTPYLICDYSVLQALVLAKRRGVDVRIMTPHIPDKKMVYILTKSNYRMLLDAGVKVYEYKPGFVHSKLFVADDEYGVVGTVNLDYRSFIHHYECGVWMYKTNSILEMKKDFLDTTKNDGIEMTKENSHLGPILRLIKIILSLFAPLL